MSSEIPQPNEPLSPAEEALVAKLHQDDLSAIDNRLLENCAGRWRKVAMVVGKTMLELYDRYPGIPDAFYARRVRQLVEERRLEAQGNLDYMRFSEIRLLAPTDQTAEA